MQNPKKVEFSKRSHGTSSLCKTTHMCYFHQLRHNFLFWLFPQTDTSLTYLILEGVGWGRGSKTVFRSQKEAYLIEFIIRPLWLTKEWSCLQFKVWVKPGAEQSFLYGNHVLKSGLGRITENTMQYQGVVVYSMADVPLVRLWISLFGFKVISHKHFFFFF